MKQGRHSKSIRSKKWIVMLVALAAVGCMMISGTLAYLFASTGSLINRFTPSRVTTTVVEKFDGEVKSDVKIKNTGSADAWVRATVVFTWQDASGKIYGAAPVEGTDYTIEYDLTHGWEKGDDGFYYWKSVLPAGQETGVLIIECKDKKTAPEGYSLHVEILGSGLQSEPVRVFQEQWDESGFVVGEDGVTLTKGGGGA